MENMENKKEIRISKELSIRIKRWGNGQGILLPKNVLKMLHLSLNDELSISVVDNNIILKPIKRKHLTLAERFAKYDYSGVEKQEEYWNDNPIGKELF